MNRSDSKFERACLEKAWPYRNLPLASRKTPRLTPVFYGMGMPLFEVDAILTGDEPASLKAHEASTPPILIKANTMLIQQLRRRHRATLFGSVEVRWG